MADRGDHLHEVLDGYAKFLQEKKLALDKHQPYLVRWVREFLLFARTHAGYSFEQTLDLNPASDRHAEVDVIEAGCDATTLWQRTVRLRGLQYIAERNCLTRRGERR